MSNCLYPRPAARAGISLLEVVFSIGVVVIGLVGIGALLPLAGVQTARGLRADRSAQLGEQGVRDFQVRGMTQPRSWRWFNGTNFVPFLPAPGQAFCVDPMLVAINVPTDAAVRNKFPYTVAYETALPPQGKVLWMPRVTLATRLTALPNDYMGLLQAKEIFVSQDELVFDLPGNVFGLPDDDTLGPVQNFGSTFDKRQVKAALSWMATVVPKLNRMGAPTAQYTLSVIVFAQRQFDANLTNEDLVNERVIQVMQFLGGSPALGGGDVVLAPRAGRPVDDMQLEKGQWVLLSGEKLTTTGTTVQVHRWYRVTNVDEEPDAAGTLLATLAGPEWDWSSMLSSASPGIYNRPNRPRATLVTIPRGVVAVFEKTIQIETSSLWTL